MKSLGIECLANISWKALRLTIKVNLLSIQETSGQVQYTYGERVCMKSTPAWPRKFTMVMEEVKTDTNLCSYAVYKSMPQ